jgi:hypothetical protein
MEQNVAGVVHRSGAKLEVRADHQGGQLGVHHLVKLILIMVSDFEFMQVLQSTSYPKAFKKTYYV